MLQDGATLGIVSVYGCSLKGSLVNLAQTLLRSPVVSALTTPHGVDRYLELVNPMWVVNDVRARIVDIKRETKAGAPVATVPLEPSAGWRGPAAGQYVPVGIAVDGARRTRAFSVSSTASKIGRAPA